MHSKYKDEFWATHLQKSPASVRYAKPTSRTEKDTVQHTFDPTSCKLVKSKRNAKKYFQYQQIDKDLVEQLYGMTKGDGEEMGVRLTSIATGSSHLHDDGSVTFMLGHTMENGKVKKYTIQNQSKDYFGSSTINSAKVKHNRDRCMASVLDGPYGSYRGYCLSSRRQKLENKDFLIRNPQRNDGQP